MTEFLFQLLGWTLNAMIAGYIAIWFYKRRQKRNDTKFLKELHLKIGGEPAIYFYSIESTNDAALAELREAVHEYINEEMEPSPRREDIPTPPPPPPTPDQLT